MLAGLPDERGHHGAVELVDIIATFAPPRLCKLGDRVFWVRPLTLDDLALLIAWLDDVLPGRAERKLAPRFGDEESQAALDSAPGFAVVCYAALRHHGVDYAEACGLSCAASDEEKARLFDVLFSRRRYGTFAGGGDDLSEGWWGPEVVGLAREYHQTMTPIGKLTLDQLDCLATNGADEEKVTRVSVDDVQAMYEAARAKAQADAERAADGEAAG